MGASLGRVLRVYVPRPASPLRRLILPGSGIVGGPQTRGRLMIDYEGNRYGAENIRTYADRVYHAWGRQTADYPTSARLWPMSGDLIAVGWFDGEHLRVVNEPDLLWWLDLVELPERELRRSGR